MPVYVAAVAAVVAAGVTAYGEEESAQASSNAAKYNSQVAADNAAIATQNANQAAATGEAQTEQSSLQARARVGGIKANAAAGNITIGEGSDLDVQSSAQQLGELNSLNIRTNAARQAYGYQTQTLNYNAQSQLDQYGASQDLTAGDIGATGTAIGGLSSGASNYAKFSNAAGGGFGGSG